MITRSAIVIVTLFLLLLGGAAVMLLNLYRANALRVECSMHLKRIGDGIYLFDGQQETLREGKIQPGVLKGRGSLPAARIAPAYATWVVQIAPYLVDKSPLLAWDMERSYFDQPAEVRQAVLPSFFCPARYRNSAVSQAGDVSAAGRHLPGTVGDYACSSGSAEEWQTAEANGAIILGEVLEKDDGRIRRWRSRTDFTSLKRGKSYTALVGEKHVPWSKFGLAEFGDGAIYNGANPASSARIGGPGHGLAADPTAPFNVNFGSCHPDICQFLMADNSVRTLHNGISEKVLGELNSRE